MRVNNVNDLFKTDFTGKSFFCILQNITWVREYLAYVAYILKYFESYETEIKIYLSLKIIIFNINFEIPDNIFF